MATYSVNTRLMDKLKSPITDEEVDLLFGFELETQATCSFKNGDNVPVSKMTSASYNKKIKEKVANFIGADSIGSLIHELGGVNTFIKLLPGVGEALATEEGSEEEVVNLPEDVWESAIAAYVIRLHNDLNRLRKESERLPVLDDTSATVYWSAKVHPQRKEVMVTYCLSLDSDGNGEYGRTFPLAGLVHDLYRQNNITTQEFFTKFNLNTTQIKVIVDALTVRMKSRFPKSSFEKSVNALTWLRENAPKEEGESDSLLHVGTDGTVKGFEIRTQDPLNHSSIRKAVDALFRWEHEVDTDCSFHVHISEVGLTKENNYNRVMQLFLYQYMMDHMDEVPDCVKVRWLKIDWLNRYFRICADDDKYRFIAYRDSHGTWEFRCFGNVNSVLDANRCIELTKSAYRWARLRVAELLGEGVDPVNAYLSLPTQDVLTKEFYLKMIAFRDSHPELLPADFDDDDNLIPPQLAVYRSLGVA